MAGNKRNLFFISAVTPSLCILHVCDWIFIQKPLQKRACASVHLCMWEMILKCISSEHMLFTTQKTCVVFFTNQLDLGPLCCLHIYSDTIWVQKGSPIALCSLINTLVVYMYPVEPNLCEFQTVASTSLQEYMGNWKTTAATGCPASAPLQAFPHFFTTTIFVVHAVQNLAL